MMNSDYLAGWDVKAEQRKADFMEHMYQCSGRANAGPGVVGLYTGLWQEFCLKEAGPFARNKYFEMLEAVKLFEEQQAKETSIVS
ncbi:MAG: hypothetical protein RJB42_1452 [Bacteroidota bacterium]